MESQKEFHCSCGRIFLSWTSKNQHLRNNRAHKDREDIDSGILAFSSLTLQDTGNEENAEKLIKKGKHVTQKAEKAAKRNMRGLTQLLAQTKLAEDQHTNNQSNEMTDPPAPVPTPTTQEQTEKQRIRAEKQAVALERKKATAERRQKKNEHRFHKRSLQKMPSSAPIASSSSQAVSSAPPRLSPRFFEAESSSSAARRPRGRGLRIRETDTDMQDTTEPMDVDMGEPRMEKESSVAEGKGPAPEVQPDVKGKGRA